MAMTTAASERHAGAEQALATQHGRAEEERAREALHARDEQLAEDADRELPP